MTSPFIRQGPVRVSEESQRDEPAGGQTSAKDSKRERRPSFKRSPCSRVQKLTIERSAYDGWIEVEAENPKALISFITTT